MIHLILALGLLLLSTLISHLNLRLLLQLARGPWVRYLLWPGVTIHELGHLIMCKFTGTRVVKVRTFLKDGGEVIHDRPTHHLVQLLISAGPLASGLVAIIVLSYALVPELLSITGSPATILQESLRILTATIGERSTLIFLLLLLSIAPTLAPSREDFQNAFPGLVLLAIGGGAVIFLAWFIAPQSVLSLSRSERSFLGPLWLLLILECIIFGLLVVVNGGRLVTRR